MAGKSKTKKLSSLRKTIRQLMRDGGTVDGPAEFLASIAAGKDPRSIKSKLYRLVKRIGDELPTEEEWQELRELVLETDGYKKQPVELKDSIFAATKLVEYLHPKQKAVEVESDNRTHTIVATPLTSKEIKRFKKHFDEEYM